jgi:hypothetical protein
MSDLFTPYVTNPPADAALMSVSGPVSSFGNSASIVTCASVGNANEDWT